MNEPIISPWLIYWAGRIDMIHHFCIVAGFLLTMGMMTEAAQQYCEETKKEAEKHEVLN